MCEGYEKSNHHANRDYQTKTMRGGEEIYRKDLLFLESSSSFIKFLRMTSELKERETNPANGTMDKGTMTVSKKNPISVEFASKCSKGYELSSPGSRAPRKKPRGFAYLVAW